MRQFRYPMTLVLMFCSTVLSLLLMNCQKSQLEKKTTGLEGNRARELAQEAYDQMAAHVFEPNELQKALVKLEAAKKINPNESFVFVTGSYWTLIKGYTIGDWYEAKTFTPGTLEESLTLAEKAVELDPQLPDAYAQMARILITKEDFNRAQTMLDKVKELDPENFYYWYYQGIYYEKRQNLESAIHFLDEAEKRAPQEYHHMIINLHRQHAAKLGHDFGKEEELLKENIKNNPNVPHVYGNYADFLMKHGRYDESIVQWEAALKLGVYNEASEKLKKAEQLRDQQNQK